MTIIGLIVSWTGAILSVIAASVGRTWETKNMMTVSITGLVMTVVGFGMTLFL